MGTIAQYLIRLYQRLISGEKSLYHRLGFPQAHTCGFYPSCSEYGYQAFGKYGFLKALRLTLRRVSRCHPWQTEHFDPLP